MNSYERMKSAINHEQPDRVPCDFSAEKEVWENLINYFGLNRKRDLLKILGIDRRFVSPTYIGPPLKTFEDGSYEVIVSEGPRMKRIPAPTGGVSESIVYFPWNDVETIEDLEGKFGWSGDIKWWDFSTIPNQLEELKEDGDYWIAAHGDPSTLQHISMWAGDEKFLMMLALDEELSMAMIEKHNKYRLEHALKTLEAGGGQIHELHGGGDFGTQTGLLISKDMFRKYFKDLYMNFYKEIKKNFEVEIFFHSCGSISQLIPELVDVGVNILNPIQVSAKGMEIEKLKSNFGNKLTFHGGIDIQQLLPYASEREVREEVRRTINILGKNGGYILSPTHMLQSDTPVRNIIAMYEEAQGRKISR